jgi:hypothetical protein
LGKVSSGDNRSGDGCGSGRRSGCVGLLPVFRFSAIAVIQAAPNEFASRLCTSRGVFVRATKAVERVKLAIRQPRLYGM